MILFFKDRLSKEVSLVYNDDLWPVGMYLCTYFNILIPHLIIYI